MGYLGTKPNVATSLQNNIVTSDKIADGVVSTADLADSAVTAAKIANSTITDTKLASGAINIQALSLFNASGSAPVYACRAWVNFNGTGTVAIRGSGNVSSLTDNATGDYTINFTIAMPDATYCGVPQGHAPGVATIVANLTNASRSASLARLVTYTLAGGTLDPTLIDCAFFR